MSTRAASRLLVPVSILVVSFSCSAWAQQKYPISMSGEGVKGRYVQQHIVDVDDAPGHQVRVYEIQRTYSPDKPIVIDGERIVEAWIRGASNYTGGIGPVWSYTTYMTDKGNKIFLESIGTSETQATQTGSRRGTYHGTAHIIGGTARFAKLRGVLVDVSQFDTDPKAGFNTVDSHGEYWFEQ